MRFTMRELEELHFAATCVPPKFRTPELASAHDKVRDEYTTMKGEEWQDARDRDAEDRHERMSGRDDW